MKSHVKPIKERLPSINKILNEAIKKLLREYNVSNLNELRDRINASEMVVELERKADNIYRDKEREALKGYLMDRGLSEKDAEKVVELIISEGNLTKEISNIRRARAGKTVEEILLTILKTYGIPCEKGRYKIQGYRPDIIVPNNAMLQSNPQKVIAIAVKRTLREMGRRY